MKNYVADVLGGAHEGEGGLMGWLGGVGFPEGRVEENEGGGLQAELALPFEEEEGAADLMRLAQGEDVGQARLGRGCCSGIENRRNRDV